MKVTLENLTKTFPGRGKDKKGVTAVDNFSLEIEDGELLTEDEQRGARKTLTAAAMTYVAATAVALAQLLRLVLVFGRRRND